MRCRPHDHDAWAPGWRGLLHRFAHSLKWRLVCLFLLLAALTTVIFVSGVHRIVRVAWEGYGLPLGNHYVDTVVAQIGTPPDIGKAQALVATLPITVLIEGPQVNWQSHPGAQARWMQRHRWLGGEMQPWHAPWHERRLADGHLVRFGLAPPPPGQMAKHYTVWGVLLLLLLVTLLTYAYVRRLLRPLEQIGAGAQRFAAGDFGHRIPVCHPDELGDLTRQINTMAGEIQRMLDAKRELLLAISHELRSPLTRARLNAELVEEGEAREALLRDLAEMRDLVSDLLESERLARGHATLHREPTALNALVQETVAAHAAGRPLQLVLEPELPIAALDRVRVKLLLRNLLDNAFRHGGDGAQPPLLQTGRSDGALRITVRDFGPGVPEDQLAQLSEAFYRPDRARQRSTGGVGLGLYLCRLVAQAHGGDIGFRDAAPGLEVSVLLPIDPSAGRAA